MDIEKRRKKLQNAAAETDTLHAAFIGLATGLIEALDTANSSTIVSLADTAGTDRDYTERWADAAFANQLVDFEDSDVIRLTPLGQAFLPHADRSMMPLAVQSVLSPRLADRLTEYLESGEQPGESILEEFDNVLPWFGRMLEGKFRPFFRDEVLPQIKVFDEFAGQSFDVLDLGCGNGWYLRELAGHYDNLRGVGLDSLTANIESAKSSVSNTLLKDRLEFQKGDIFEYRPDRTFDAVVLNRTVHHLWTRRDDLLATLDAVIGRNGRLVIWEPAWPEDRASLRSPNRRGLGMRNLAEHAMGNQLLTPGKLVDWLDSSDMVVETQPIDEVETIFVARRHM